MSAGDVPTERPPPDADALLGLDSDTWAALLGHLRAVLAALPDDEVTPQVARLREASVGQLAGGPRRKELCRLVAQDGPLWHAVRDRLRRTDGLPSDLAALVAEPAVPGTPDTQPGGDVTAIGIPGSTGGEELGRLRGRLRAAREERDDWRRRAEGERVRAVGLEQRLAEVVATRDELERELAEVRSELHDSDERRTRAVAREQRRRDTELRTLRDEIAALRRAEEDRRARRRRERDREQQRAERAVEQMQLSQRRARSAPHPRVVPGRPTRLPPDVAVGTTEAAGLLLQQGRIVVVDGYNVTLRHRGHLDLETQRSWLVRLLATLAARRGIRPVVVFDGEGEGGGRPPTGLRDVEVRFSTAGVSADDEIVLAVEGTDDPLVVVTDDRELVSRVRLGGADVISTGQLLGVAS